MTDLPAVANTVLKLHTSSSLASLQQFDPRKQPKPARLPRFPSLNIYQSPDRTDRHQIEIAIRLPRNWPIRLRNSTSLAETASTIR